MKKNKTVFIEYSTARKGQHFMTVIQVIDGKRIIIGRMFRKYDKETEKTTYWATDWAGNQVFADVKDLYALKKNFIEHGDTLAMIIPADLKPKKDRDEYPYSEKIGKKKTNEEPSRENELKQVRQRNSQTTEKEKETKVEKEHDDNLEKEHEEKYENNEQNNQDEKEQQREQELEQVRDNNNDQEKNEEMEQEMDL